VSVHISRPSSMLSRVFISTGRTIPWYYDQVAESPWSSNCFGCHPGRQRVTKTTSSRWHRGSSAERCSFVRVPTYRRVETVVVGMLLIAFAFAGDVVVLPTPTSTIAATTSKYLLHTSHLSRCQARTLIPRRMIGRVGQYGLNNAVG
jgi:hypothetical protein